VSDTTRELAAHHEDAWGWALACCRFDHDEAQEVLQQAYLPRPGSPGLPG